MKNLLKSINFCLFIVINISAFGQNGSANGWFLPSNTLDQNGNHHPIRVLAVCVEINYDDSLNRPTWYDINNLKEYWQLGQIPQNIQDWFDPQSTNDVTQFFDEASLGNLRVEGDILQNIITVNESDVTDLYRTDSEGKIVNFGGQPDFLNEIFKKFNSLSSFNTVRNTPINDFDNWNDNNIQGAQKTMGTNNGFDYIAFFIRNHTSNGDVGFAENDEDSINAPFNNTIYTADNIHMQNGNEFKTFIHEMGHLFLGGNSFHAAGGQHNHNSAGANYFGPRQSGWGIMGFGSLQTVNAWERDRLNWIDLNTPNRNLTGNIANHEIYALNQSFVNTSGDIDPNVNNTTQTFWIRDFVTTGDAIRIRLPFIDQANEFEQWLWLENHQTTLNNNSNFDDLIFSSNACRPNATPGLYAYIQVEKNNKLNFGGFGDYLRVLPANGFFDYQLPGTTNMDCVAFNNDSSAAYYKKTKTNPLSGASDLEYLITDKNNDNRIELGEEIITFIEERNGSPMDDLPFHGLSNHAFTLTGNNKLGMGTNPSANSMLTEVSFDEARDYNTVRNNRIVYLNGVSVEIIGEQANANNANMMDLQIKVRFDDVAINQNVNYSADNIVLPDIVQSGTDLEIAANRCVFIYHGTTPTNVGIADTSYIDNSNPNNPIQINTQTSTFTSYKNNIFFSKPTKFFIEPNANAHLNAGATIEVQDDSRLILRPNSSITLDANAKIVVKDDAKMILHPDAFIDFATGSYIDVKDNATLIIKAGNEVELSGLPEVRVTGNGKIIIEDDATLQVAGGGLIDIQQGATLEYQNSVVGKGLQFGAYGTAGGNEVELRIDGNLVVKFSQNFTFNGNGYLNFYPNNNLILPQGCSFNLTGQLAGGQDLIFKIQPNTIVTFNDANVNLNQGKIEFGNLSQFQHTSGSLKLSNMLAQGATANNAFLANQLSSVSISGSVFQDFSSGNSLNIQNSNIINLFGVTFNNCPYPLALSANNKTSLFSCNFNHPIGQGVEAIQISNQWPTYINSTQIENYQKAIYLDNAEGVYLNNSTLNNNNYGVYGFDSELFLRNNTAITNSTFNGVYLDSYAKYQGLLVMGDVGCASISNSSGSGIKGDDIEFSIDAVEHAFSGLNGGMVIPNRIYCNNPKNIDVCYKLQFDANNNYVVPSKVLGKGNFYKKDTESCTEIESPTNDDFLFAISPKCNLNTIPFDYSNYSLCNPPDGNCLACNPNNELPLDRTWPSLRQSYTNAYAAFALKDTTTTRAAFVSLAAISLFKINEDVWSISIQGDTNDISDEDAAMIITAKCLYKDTSGLKSNKIRYPGAIDLFEVKTDDKNLINQNQTFSVYPNPTSQNFTIKTNGNSITNYRLLTINKTVIKQGAFKGETTINTTDLNAGIYLLQLNSFNATETRKIIIE